MPTEEHFRRLERIYNEAPTNVYFAPRIEIAEGRAVVRLRVKPDFFHAAGAVHGSVYFKMLDDAAFFAANSMVDEVFVLTANFNLHFLRPVSAGELRAEGRLVSRSRRVLTCSADLYDDAGKLLATGSGGFMPSALRLDDWDSTG